MERHATLRIGTRQSPLARAQTQLVIDLLNAHYPEAPLTFAIHPIVTSGDLIKDRTLAEIGGKGLFTRELEKALADGVIDCAVHSLKDMDTQTFNHNGLVTDCFLPRALAHDVLVSHSGWQFHELPQGARIGTVSPRRRAQLLALRPDLNVMPLRGNVNTRLAKLQEKHFDAIILAFAGLIRLGIDPRNYAKLDGPDFLPAPAQGVIAVQRRDHDSDTRAYLEPLNHSVTQACITAERSVLVSLGGSCHTPIGVLASPSTSPRHGTTLSLEARLYAPSGETFWHESASGTLDQAATIGLTLGTRLRNRVQQSPYAGLILQDS